MENKIHDLDDVLLSQRTYDSWSAYAPIAVQDILKGFKDKKEILTPKDIPDEQFRELSDGTGEIFILIPRINKEIKMRVPKGEWSLV